MILKSSKIDLNLRWNVNETLLFIGLVSKSYERSQPPSNYSILKFVHFIVYAFDFVMWRMFKPNVYKTVWNYTLCKISLLRGISKSLQRLPRKPKLWEGLWVCHILQSWGHFFLGPWLYVCQFIAISKKWSFWRNCFLKNATFILVKSCI